MALPATNDGFAPSTKRTYEIHRYAQGRWLVDTVADDKEIAIDLAKELMTSKRPPSGVRVMAVEMKDTGKFSEISVYRSTMADQGRDDAPATRPKLEVKSKTTGEQRDFKHTGARPPGAKSKANGLKNLLRAMEFATVVGALLAAAEAMRILIH